MISTAGICYFKGSSLKKACASIILFLAFFGNVFGQNPANTVPSYSHLNGVDIVNLSIGLSGVNTEAIPISIDVDSQNFVYVLTFGNGIQKRNPDGSITNSNFITGLSSPLDVAIDSNDFFYVADYSEDGSCSENGKIKIYKPNGSFDREIYTGFYRPLGVEVDSDGNIYVAEYNQEGNGCESDEKSRVSIYNSSGTRIAQNTNVLRPYRIGVSSDKTVYLSQAGNEDPKVLTLDQNLSITGNLPNIESPGSVVVDSFDFIHVVEYASRIDFSRFINFENLSFGQIQDIAEEIDRGIDDNAFSIKIFDAFQNFEKSYKEEIQFPVDIAFNFCDKMYVNNSFIDGSNSIFGYIPNKIEFDLEIYERTPSFDTTPPDAVCVAPGKEFTLQNGKVVLTPEDIDNGSTDNCGIDSIELARYEFDTTGPHTVSLIVTDDAGNITICATTIDIVGEGQTPPETTPDFYNTDFETALNVTASTGVLSNDTDPDGDALTANLVGNVSNGTLTLNSNGSFTYLPDVGFSGEDSFTYRANDGELDSNLVIVTITVNPEPNQAPTAVANQYELTENETLTIPAPGILENDSDPDDDALTAKLQSNVSNGTLTLNPNGSFTYTPDTDYTGQDSFTYVANDGELDSNTVTVTIIINPGANEPPVASCNNFEIILNSNGQAQISAAQVSDGNEDLELSIDKSNFSCDDIGDNTVVLTVTDPETGLSDTCNATIRVIDNSAPQITNCANSNFEVRIPEGESYMLPNFENQFTAIDNCDNDLDFTQDPQAGTPYSETTNVDVRVRFTDDSGRSQSCLFTINIVVVEEDELVLNCSEIYEIEPDGNCNFLVPDLSAIVNFSPEEASISQSITQGAIITEDTEVTITATYNNQQEECTVLLKLVNNPPEVSCPADKSVNVAAGEEYTLPDYRDELNIEEDCGDITIIQTPSPNTAITDDTKIIFEVSDSSGNSTTCSFDLELVSEGTLDISCPGDQTFEFEEDCSYPLPDFRMDAEVSNGEGQVTQEPAPGTSIVASETEVTLSITSNGESDSCTFMVFLEDTTAPEISCPSDKSINIAAGEEFTLPDYSSELNIEEGCGGITIEQTPPPNTVITGDVQINFEVGDFFGNFSTCSFELELVPEGDLTINCPAPKTLEFDENCSFTLPDFTAEAEVSNGNGQEIVQTPAPGTLITGNEAEVTLSITSDGVTESCSFPITLQDNTPPEIRLKDITINLNSNGNTAITFDDIDNGSFDNCDPDVTYTLSKSSFSCKEVGDNLVQVIAEDSSGNTSTANTTVTVIAEDGICEEPPLEGSEYIFIYPNPNTGSFKIATPGDVKLERIEVFDHRGRFIAAKDYESTDLEYAMDLGPLQEAVYVLKIITDKNTVTKRFIFKY